MFALVLAAVAIGGLVRAFEGGREQLPASGTAWSNASDLSLAWTGSLGGAGTYGRFLPSPPAVVDGIVYEGTESGKVYAFSASCASGGNECEPLWVGSTDAAIPVSPTVVGGVVFVLTETGRLFAFSASCGTNGATCNPLWIGDVGAGSDAIGSPVVVDGTVYAVDPSAGVVSAFDANCGTGAQDCEPIWRASTGPGWTMTPTVADGVVYAVAGDEAHHGRLYAFDSRSGELRWIGVSANDYGAPGTSTATSQALVAGGRVFVLLGDTLNVFPVDCATNGSTCSPEWTAPATSAPVVADDRVYVGLGGGTLHTFALGCTQVETGCSPLWSGVSEACCAGIAVDGEHVYLSERGGGLIEALPTMCSGTCLPLWRFEIDGSVEGRNDAYHETPPIVVDGVVLGKYGGTAYALASCGTGGTVCKPFWTWNAPSDARLSSPTVANGMLLFASSDGRLYAFSPVLGQ